MSNQNNNFFKEGKSVPERKEDEQEQRFTRENTTTTINTDKKKEEGKSVPEGKEDEQEQRITRQNTTTTINTDTKKVPVGLGTFLEDPYRGGEFAITLRQIKALGANDWLGTWLIDYLLMRSLSTVGFPDNFIFSSSDAYLLMLQAVRKAKSARTSDMISCQRIRAKNVKFSLHPYQLCSIVCNGGHFWFIHLTFNAQANNLDGLFTHVKVYDSMVNVGQEVSLSSSSLGGTVLIMLQEYLKTFCFHESKFYKELYKNPYKILQSARACPCPQQINAFDCGLFALANCLHVCKHGNVTSDSYSPDCISELRFNLHEIFTKKKLIPNPRNLLSPEFVNYCFPELRRKDYTDNHLDIIKEGYDNKMDSTPTITNKKSSVFASSWKKKPPPSNNPYDTPIPFSPTIPSFQLPPFTPNSRNDHSFFTEASEVGNKFQTANEWNVKEFLQIKTVKEKTRAHKLKMNMEKLGIRKKGNFDGFFDNINCRLVFHFREYRE